MKIFIKYDKKFEIPISCDNNLLLFRAIDSDDEELAKLVIQHKQFKYDYGENVKITINTINNTCPFRRWIKSRIGEYNSAKDNFRSHNIPANWIDLSLERIEKFVCLLIIQYIKFAARSIYPFFKKYGNIPDYECDCEFAKQIKEFIRS